MTEVPLELQKKLDMLKITWAWFALVIGPLCIGAAFYLFVGAWRGPGTAYWEENYVYEPSECKILEQKLTFLDTSHGKACRPELLIEYQWKGTDYQLWTYRRDTLLGDAYIRPRPADAEEGDAGQTPEQARKRAQGVLDRYPMGSTQPCWIDPNDPSKAILRKWRYIALLFTMPAVGILALISGILSLWHLLVKLHERRQLIKRFENNPLGWNHGTHFPYCLELESESRGKLLFKVWAASLWTTVALIFVVSAWERKFIPVLLSSGLFAYMGIAWFFVSIKKFIFHRIGKSEVEMEFQPFTIGQVGKILVSQHGPLNVDQYTISLRCRELTTFTEGTDTRTDSKEVFRQLLFEEKSPIINGLEPYRNILNFTIRDGAPASFKAEHNEIRWDILVEGVRRGQTAFSRSFPFEVQATFAVQENHDDDT